MFQPLKTNAINITLKRYVPNAKIVKKKVMSSIEFPVLTHLDPLFK